MAVYCKDAERSPRASTTAEALAMYGRSASPSRITRVEHDPRKFYYPIVLQRQMLDMRIFSLR